jgi:transposase
MWCVPQIDAEFVTRMEKLLRLFAKPENPLEPVVCIDERPIQLLDSKRPGTANIFCIVEPRAGRRQTHATPNRNGAAFARALKRIAKRYRKARRIHLVLDNLSTHSEQCLRSHLGDRAGAKLWRRFVIHFTPKHASWLNPAEMEVSLVSRECIGNRRFGTFKVLRAEVTSWNRRADHDRRRIDWKWRVSDARRVFRYDGINTKRLKD